jgi:molybdate transport system ATP-binding protein
VKDIIQTYSELPGKTLIMVTHYEEELPECFTLRKQLIKQQ